MTYQLYCDDLALGSVTKTDSDFPWFYGTFAPSFDKNAASESLDHIIDYYRYSIAADGLLNNDTQERWLAYVDEHEHRFEDLIESSQWRLQEPKGKTSPILIPIFSSGDEIRWRLE